MRHTPWLVPVLGLWQVSAPYALHLHQMTLVGGSVVIGALTALFGALGASRVDHKPFVATALLGLATVGLPFVSPTPAVAEFLIAGFLVFVLSLWHYVERIHP